MINLIKNIKDIEDRVLIFTGYIDCFQKEVKPFYDSLELQPWIRDEVEDYAREHFSRKKVIGVHIRYHSKEMPFVDHHAHYWSDFKESLSSIKSKIDEAVRKIDTTEYVIFLATDSRKVFEALSENYPHILAYEKRFGLDESIELHEELPVETGLASVAEMFLLARSDILVRYPPSGSLFSFYASLYANEVIV